MKAYIYIVISKNNNASVGIITAAEKATLAYILNTAIETAGYGRDTNYYDAQEVSNETLARLALIAKEKGLI